MHLNEYNFGLTILPKHKLTHLVQQKLCVSSEEDGYDIIKWTQNSMHYKKILLYTKSFSLLKSATSRKQKLTAKDPNYIVFLFLVKKTFKPEEPVYASSFFLLDVD